jgi:hypothetical protein
VTRGLVVGLLACSGASLTAQQPQFRAGTSVVRLEVRVTNDRGPVRGLTKNDFVVSDNGTRVDFRVEEQTDLPLDLLLVAVPLASVNLVAADQTSRVAAGLTAFLEHVEARDRLAVMLAGAPPRRLRGLESGPPALGIDAFGSGAYAAPYDAIVAGLGEFDDADRRKAVILFTTGADFRSTVDMDSAADTIIHAGLTFVAVGTLVPVDDVVHTGGHDPFTGIPVDPVDAKITGGVWPATLRQLARKTGGITVSLSAGAPADLVSGMFVWLRTQYLVSYPTPAGPGRHAVSVKVNRRGARVVTRDAYFVQ